VTECITRTRWRIHSAHRTQTFSHTGTPCTFNVRPTCPRFVLVQYKATANVLDEVRKVCRDIRRQVQLGMRALNVCVLHQFPNLDETSRAHYNRPGHRDRPPVAIGIDGLQRWIMRSSAISVKPVITHVYFLSSLSDFGAWLQYVCYYYFFEVLFAYRAV